MSKDLIARFKDKFLKWTMNNHDHAVKRFDRYLLRFEEIEEKTSKPIKE